MKRKAPQKATFLEVVLQMQGELRKTLEPLGVTPLQAGVLIFFLRHAKTNLTDVIATLGVNPPTLSEVVNDLARKQWVTKRRSVKDSRAVQFQLSRQGHMLAGHIEQRMDAVETAWIKA